MTTWAWTGPGGKPVSVPLRRAIFRPVQTLPDPGRRLYEFTAALPGQKLETKWRFTLVPEPWFWIAGIVKEGCFAMLTTAPSPDIAPYHDRQVVVLKPSQAMDWLHLSLEETDLLRPAPAGALDVVRAFPAEA